MKSGLTYGEKTWEQEENGDGKNKKPKRERIECTHTAARRLKTKLMVSDRWVNFFSSYQTLAVWQQIKK